MLVLPRLAPVKVQSSSVDNFLSLVAPFLFDLSHYYESQRLFALYSRLAGLYVLAANNAEFVFVS